MRLPDTYGDSRTRVLLAVIAQDRPTVRSVAAAVGLNGTNVHRHIRALAKDGLVTYAPGRSGTLRSAVRPAHFPDE